MAPVIKYPQTVGGQTSFFCVMLACRDCRVGDGESGEYFFDGHVIFIVRDGLGVHFYSLNNCICIRQIHPFLLQNFDSIQTRGIINV